MLRNLTPGNIPIYPRPYIVEVFRHSEHFIGMYSFSYGYNISGLSKKSIAIFDVRPKGTPRPPETRDKWPVADRREWPCDECDTGEVFAVVGPYPNGQTDFECNTCGYKVSFP